jgi:hypothetical protein
MSWPRFSRCQLLLQNTRLLNDTRKVRDRLLVDDRGLRLSRLPGDLRQVSTGQYRQEAGCHGPSKRRSDRLANRPIDWA